MSEPENAVERMIRVIFEAWDEEGASAEERERRIAALEEWARRAGKHSDAAE